MATTPVTIPLSTLLRQYNLGLVQITHSEDDERSQAPVQWVHGSDLLNPAPFLTPRTVLMTTGSQFVQQSNEGDAHSDYVTELLNAGVCALGFAVNFAYERIPESLIDACERQGLPLFRVPYSTPFIAISQTAARLINKIARERDDWSIAAQRAVALAALQRDGLTVTIHELGKQLASWVALYDSRGKLIARSQQPPATAAESEWMLDEVRSLLQSQTRASKSVSNQSERITLQSLGRRGQLLGVLAVRDAGTLDYAAQSVIGIVVALASLTLEQNSALNEPLEQIRTAVLELLLDSQSDLAQRIAAGRVRELPGEPIVCASIRPSSEDRGSVLAELQTLEEAGVYAFFHAQLGDEVVVVAAEKAAAKLAEALENAPSSVGISSPGTYATFASTLDRARLARDASAPGSLTQVRRYSSSLDFGVLELLDSNDEAIRRATALIEPLLQNDERNSETLTESVRVWISHDGQFAPASAELGIHRHTLKSRVARASQILGKDLSRFEVRAEMWIALKLENTAA